MSKPTNSHQVQVVVHVHFMSNLGLRKSKVLDKCCSEWINKDFYVVANISVVQILDFVPIIC